MFLCCKRKASLLLARAEGDMANAVCRFFEKWNPEKAIEHSEIRDNWEEITDGGNLVFGIEKDYAQEDAEIKEIWDSQK